MWCNVIYYSMRSSPLPLLAEIPFSFSFSHLPVRKRETEWTNGIHMFESRLIDLDFGSSEFRTTVSDDAHNLEHMWSTHTHTHSRLATHAMYMHTSVYVLFIYYFSYFVVHDWTQYFQQLWRPSVYVCVCAFVTTRTEKLLLQFIEATMTNYVPVISWLKKGKQLRACMANVSGLENASSQILLCRKKKIEKHSTNSCWESRDNLCFQFPGRHFWTQIYSCRHEWSE